MRRMKLKYKHVPTILNCNFMDAFLFCSGEKKKKLKKIVVGCIYGGDTHVFRDFCMHV